jgi:uncharacterized membrane protein YqaE (UPF0057 family)
MVFRVIHRRFGRTWSILLERHTVTVGVAKSVRYSTSVLLSCLMSVVHSSVLIQPGVVSCSTIVNIMLSCTEYVGYSFAWWYLMSIYNSVRRYVVLGPNTVQISQVYLQQLLRRMEFIEYIRTLEIGIDTAELIETC